MAKAQAGLATAPPPARRAALIDGWSIGRSGLPDPSQQHVQNEPDDEDGCKFARRYPVGGLRFAREQD